LKAFCLINSMDVQSSGRSASLHDAKKVAYLVPYCV
jgi:hypothetical protein